MATIPHPKNLEGRKDDENETAMQSRDFLFDSITIYVVAAILGLTAVVLITEFISQSTVQCYLPGDTNQSLLEGMNAYVNEFCSAHLPSLQYLSAFLALHAVFILTPHYLWLNMYGADLDFFFQHVSQLHRTRDQKTGNYPPINYIISEQLQDAFKRFSHSNGMYYFFIVKLVLQLIICLVGFIVVPWQFSGENQLLTFECPNNPKETHGRNWPLPDNTHVVCVYSSLSLLHKIWGFYLFLLTVVSLSLIINIVTISIPHPYELGYDNRAEFSFQTGMPHHSYAPQHGKYLLRHLKKILRDKSMSSPYTIKCSYDFLMIKLFRTDGGLAHILREIHVLQLLKTRCTSDIAIGNIFKTHSGTKHQGKCCVADLHHVAQQHRTRE